MNPGPWQPRPSPASRPRQARRLKIVIPGGSGQVGTILARAFHPEHDVVVLSRREITRPWRPGGNPRIVAWDGATLGAWQHEIDGCDAVINLAGRSVNCRYGADNRREILASRVVSTRVVGRAIAGARQPPAVWLQASTATIYAHRFDGVNDERSGVLGGSEKDAPATWRFSIDVARAWEQAFDEAATPDTRKVLLRSAMTLSPDRGGVFDTLLALARHGLGGRIGSGRQFMSWVHHEDFSSAVQWLIDRHDVAGIVNIAAPNPLPNAEFMRVLRRACGAHIALPAQAWMVEIGAWLMRTESELILKSRRVVPGRLLENGFLFRWPAWAGAAPDLCRQWDTMHRTRAA